MCQQAKRGFFPSWHGFILICPVPVCHTAIETTMYREELKEHLPPPPPPVGAQGIQNVQKKSTFATGENAGASV